MGRKYRFCTTLVLGRALIFRRSAAESDWALPVVGVSQKAADASLRVLTSRTSPARYGPRARPCHPRIWAKPEAVDLMGRV